MYNNHRPSLPAFDELVDKKLVNLQFTAVELFIATVLISSLDPQPLPALNSITVRPCTREATLRKNSVISALSCLIFTLDLLEHVHGHLRTFLLAQKIWRIMCSAT